MEIDSYFCTKCREGSKAASDAEILRLFRRIKMKKILIVDDHAIVRTGIKLLSREIPLDIELLDAASEKEAFEALKGNPDLDIVILDVNIPEFDCSSMVEYIREHLPHARIMILSMNSERLMAKRFYKLGVSGYVHKNSDDEEIKRAIMRILSGKKYLSADMMDLLAEETFDGKKADDPFDPLSQREMEVVLLMVKGASTQEISDTLSLHSSTVGTYKSRVFEKLKVKNIIELYNLYMSHYGNS